MPGTPLKTPPKRKNSGGAVAVHTTSGLTASNSGSRIPRLKAPSTDSISALLSFSCIIKLSEQARRACLLKWQWGNGGRCARIALAPASEIEGVLQPATVQVNAWLRQRWRMAVAFQKMVWRLGLVGRGDGGVNRRQDDIDVVLRPIGIILHAGVEELRPLVENFGLAVVGLHRGLVRGFRRLAGRDRLFAFGPWIKIRRKIAGRACSDGRHCQR